MTAHSPILILIRPQMGENIGAVARAMANFGLSELRIVAPRDGWPNSQAEAMATNALPILQAAKIYDDNAEAFADITRAYATTARPRELAKRVVTPQEAVGEILQNTSPLEGEGRVGGGSAFSASGATPHPNPLPQGEREKYAFVFGPERTGLTNDDLAWCETIVTIPTTGNASLNIAQSAVVLAYEYHKQWAVDGGQTTSDASTVHCPLPAAPLAEYDQLFRQLEGHLDASDFFKVAEKKPGMWLNIKTMLLRGRFTSQEIRTLHGIVRALAEGK